MKMGLFGKNKKSKKDEMADAVLFRSGKKVKGKYSEYLLMPSGGGNKKHPNYGLKSKKVSRNVGLGLKKRYGMTVHSDQYGSYGYKGKVPKRIF